MKDGFGRNITYLRISLTDRCNLRCRYCMPAEGIEKQSHSDILSLEEVAEIAGACAALGVRKIRLTGGEPLLRRGLVGLCRTLSALDGVEELALTTNATFLAPLAGELNAAGVTRVNISLDTLDPDLYRDLTRGGELADALDGIRAAAQAGLGPIKLNAVLLGGINDSEIPALADLSRRYPVSVRFIELMPVGEGKFLPESAFLSADTVPARLPELVYAGREGVAELYRFPGAPGTVGLIRPVSCSFCSGCDRLRLTADGFFKPCLHSDTEIPVRGLHGEELTRAILAAAGAKPAEHPPLLPGESAERRRTMNQIGG